MSLQIVGAGLAGLLAGNMLQRHKPTITEQQHLLPNNHSAVLRFRGHEIGDILNIPFKKVTMIKCVVPYLNPVADALSYSHKNTGIYRSDRSIITGLVTADRYIAPPDLIARMAAPLTIKYNSPFQSPAGWVPVVSTMPMPALMSLLEYPRAAEVEFTSKEGLNIRCLIDSCDAYVSLLVPDPHSPISRISITGNEMIVEVPNFKFEEHSEFEKFVSAIGFDIAQQACKFAGIPNDAIVALGWHRQKYAKINPIDDDVRKDFIYWATDKHGIFSLGRFATWRPGLLLDDLVKDIRLIDKWVSRQDRYEVARNR